ncbi:MAG: hypothetical protein IPP73_10045 [Chitinophagaceae bacterium]|nr:hypothetical protein [Chitinophagaceae bacterium]
MCPTDSSGYWEKESLTDVKLGDPRQKLSLPYYLRTYGILLLSPEQMTPDENFHFVSSFNERLGPVIRSNHGFINQYLDDSIMAIFPRTRMML